MKKDLFLEGIDSVDDELIAEAASASGFGYKTKISIIRALVVGAAAAAMITTGVLLHSKNADRNGDGGDPDHFVINTPEGEADTSAAASGDGSSAAVPTEAAPDKSETSAEAVTESVDETEAETVSVPEEDTVPAIYQETTEADIPDDEPETDTLPEVTEGVTTSAEEYEPTTVTSEAEGDTEAHDITVSGAYIPEGLPVDDGSYVPEEDIPASEEPEWTLPEEASLLPPLTDYSYENDPDVVSVQYGNAVIRDRDNLWLNCTKEQADRWLDYISSLKASDEGYEEIGFEGGGYIVRVNYSDGTSAQYELYGQFEQLCITARDGTSVRLKDVSGSYDEFFNEVYNAFLSHNNEIDEYLASR